MGRYGSLRLPGALLLALGMGCRPHVPKDRPATALPVAIVAEVKPLPPPDRDSDTTPDARDACPDEPEDLDKFEDQDGCVDRDNDEDGIPDAHEFIDGRWTVCDGCPANPASPGDLDGCPDFSVGFCGSISIGVLSYTRTSGLTAAELEPLAEVVRVMQEKPHIRVYVDAHVDQQRLAESARRITQKLADMTLEALVARGITRERLEARGWGDKTPRAHNRTAEGRASNRRIEFTVVDPESFNRRTELVCE